MTPDTSHRSIDFVLLTVTDVPRSVDFYAALLGVPPVETSPTFAMFAQPNGQMLGLWKAGAPWPTAGQTPGLAEFAFVEGDVDAAHALVAARGVPTEGPPVDLDFGRTFLARDPDGHRVRFFRPNEG